MDELAFLTLTGRAKLTEEAAVKVWRERSRLNAERIGEISTILSLTAEADTFRKNLSPPSAGDLLRGRMPHGGVRPPARVLPLPRKQATRRDFPSRALLPWAAVFALVVGIAALWNFRPMTGGYAMSEIVTGVAETATVVLGDGTVVRLAPESRLHVTGGANHRSVSLRGRAYFAVARNGGEPFRIRTASGTVEVLGTRFDLSADNSDLRVTVVEGTVLLDVDGGRNRVEGGQVGRVVRGTLLPPEDVPDPRDLIDWMGNFMAFQATPLGDAALEIERVFGVDVVFEHPEVAERTVTIYFADWPLEDVVSSLCLIVRAHCTIEGDQVTVSRLTGQASAYPNGGSPR